MYSLLIDTHLYNTMIILYKDGKKLIIEEIESTNGHSEVAIPTLENVLKKQNIQVTDLKEIIVINGPGSFTGVRIGVTIAKTLAYTLNIPIKCLSSLLLKAICIDGEKKVYIKDKNGYFIGEFDSKNNLIGEYEYKTSKEINPVEFREPKSIDFDKIYEYTKSLPSQNPHSLKPTYVKKIQVEIWLG